MAEKDKKQSKKESKEKTQNEMICIVRIRGRVGVNRKIEETLRRLRLGRKYTCSVVPSTPENLGMIKKIKDFVAFGSISPETYEKLKDARGKKDKEGNLKKYFRLHPPRGGIETKKHYPKGVLGNHKDQINKLIERMF